MLYASSASADPTIRLTRKLAHTKGTCLSNRPSTTFRGVLVRHSTAPAWLFSPGMFANEESP
eukprot:6757810-Pyramimonas_sp.AAC.1